MTKQQRSDRSSKNDLTMESMFNALKEAETLRDRFAMAALPKVSWDDLGEYFVKRVAQNAYVVADAMLKARKK